MTWLEQVKARLADAVPLQADIYESEAEGIHLKWINPWARKSERIASFWWPEHPIEATENAESKSGIISHSVADELEELINDIRG